MGEDNTYSRSAEYSSYDARHKRFSGNKRFFYIHSEKWKKQSHDYDAEYGAYAELYSQKYVLLLLAVKHLV